MSFKDFLCDRVSIHPMKRNTSNRTKLDQMANSQEAVREHVPCRIRGEKAVFFSDVMLSVGDVIADEANSEQYEVTGKKLVRGITEQHHRTYTVKRRALHGRIGNTD